MDLLSLLDPYFKGMHFVIASFLKLKRDKDLKCGNDVLAEYKALFLMQYYYYNISVAFLT